MTQANEKATRFRFVQDGDGHWYVIQVREQEAFDKWEAAGPYWEGYEGFNFDKVRVGGHPSLYTFTDPIEEEK